MPLSHRPFPIPAAAALAPALGLAVALLLAAPAQAQNPFAAQVIVDDRVITRFDVAQRALFLEIFNTPGDLEAQAIERLIEERLQLAEARRLGIRPDDAEIAEGIAEFASRFELSPEDFLEALEEAGHAPESFRAFVEAGIAWRQVLQRRFAGRIEITEAEAERARQTVAYRGRPRVLLSELVLPATPDNIELAEMIARDSTPEEFAESARLFSASESRARGGRLDWIELEALPPDIRPVVEGLRPGQISPPIDAEGAVVLFLMRQIDRSPRLAPARIEVSWVRAELPAAEAEAELARLRAGADSCADFKALTAHLPQAAVEASSGRLPDLPASLSVALGRLDAGEIGTTPAEGGMAALVMLCSRTPDADLVPEGATLRDLLADRRLQALSDGLVAELRAAAIIERR